MRAANIGGWNWNPKGNRVKSSHVMDYGQSQQVTGTDANPTD